MSNPDDVARLREIKRLLDRIQRLPQLAAGPASGLAYGFHGRHVGPLHLAGPPMPESRRQPELVLARTSESAPASRPAEAPVGVPTFDPPIEPPLELPLRERVGPQESRALVPVQPTVKASISPWIFIAATAVNTVVAAVLAVVITLGVARRDSAPAETEKAAALTAKAAVADPTAEPPAVPVPIELLPVGSPAEPLRLEALKPTRLPFQVRPEEAAQESYILLLSGLPANATLVGASRMGADSWLLSAGALQRIEIMVPEWTASVAEVGVELRRTNGAIVAQSKLWLAVPPPAAAPAANLDDSAIKELVRNGDRLLNRGDVAAARALYERAAAMGNAQAALALGATYDQRRLWSLGVFGMVGDKERARQWYARADQLGHPEARARMTALK